MPTQQTGTVELSDNGLDLSGEVIDRIDRSDIDIYVVASKPMVELPATTPGRSRETIPLSHVRFEAFLASFAWTHLRCVLSNAEIKGITRVLEGIAWEQEETELPLESARDHEPLLDAMMLHMSRSRSLTPYEKSASQLKIELDEVAKSEGLDMNHPGWPRTAVWLSRQLFSDRLQPYLEAAGLSVTQGRRTSQSRTIRINRHDSSDSNSSSVSQHRQRPDCPSGRDLSEHDGNDTNHHDFSDIAIGE